MLNVILKALAIYKRHEKNHEPFHNIIGNSFFLKNRGGNMNNTNKSLFTLRCVHERVGVGGWFTGQGQSPAQVDYYLF